MKIEYDPKKSETNAAARDLPFSKVVEFAFESAVTGRDVRFDYPEPRFVATGMIGDRLHVLCYTPIDGGIRVISLRKANVREVRKHDKQTADR